MQFYFAILFPCSYSIFVKLAVIVAAALHCVSDRYLYRQQHAEITVVLSNFMNVVMSSKEERF